MQSDVPHSMAPHPAEAENSCIHLTVQVLLTIVSLGRRERGRHRESVPNLFGGIPYSLDIRILFLGLLLVKGGCEHATPSRVSPPSSASEPRMGSLEEEIGRKHPS